MVRVQGQNRLPRQSGQPLNARLSPGGALVDAGFAPDQGTGITGTVRIATARALRLRQQRVNGVDAGCVPHAPTLN